MRNLFSGGNTGHSFRPGDPRRLDNDCGTAACIAGWAVTLKYRDAIMAEKADPIKALEHIPHARPWMVARTEAEEFLGISSASGERLFHVERWPIVMQNNWDAAHHDPAKQAQVARDRIFLFIDTLGAT